MKKEEVVEILKEHGFILGKEISIPHGTQLIFRNGAMVSVYNTGKINVQGKHFDLVTKLLAKADPSRQVGDVGNTDDEF